MCLVSGCVLFLGRCLQSGAHYEPSENARFFFFFFGGGREGRHFIVSSLCYRDSLLCFRVSALNFYEKNSCGIFFEKQFFKILETHYFEKYISNCVTISILWSKKGKLKKALLISKNNSYENQLKNLLERLN